jgi:hypothetical protein
MMNRDSNFCNLVGALGPRDREQTEATVYSFLHYYFRSSNIYGLTSPGSSET